MALIIRGGRIHTMTPQGTLTGDILIAHGRVLRVADHIAGDDAFTTSTFDARGLTIMPGLVDAAMRRGCLPIKDAAWQSLMSGVTSGLLLPEDGCACRMLCGGRVQPCSFRLIDPSDLDDDELCVRFGACCKNSMRPVCPVSNLDDCARVLDAKPPRGMLLLGLHGCEEMAGNIAGAGASAVVGVDRRASHPSSVAEALIAAGVPTAITSFGSVDGSARLRLDAGHLMHCGVGEEKAMACITRDAAAMLDLPDRGCIAPGYRADMTIFDGHPLLISSTLVATVADGCVIRRA